MVCAANKILVSDYTTSVVVIGVEHSLLRGGKDKIRILCGVEYGADGGEGRVLPCWEVPYISLETAKGNFRFSNGSRSRSIPSRIIFVEIYS